MEIVLSRDMLLPVLIRGAGVVERRQTLPILANLLVSAEGFDVTVVGTDLEVEIRGSCTGEVRKEGACTIPARKLLDIVRNLEEGAEVRIRMADEKCTVTAGRGRFSLGTLPATDFPSLSQDGEARRFLFEEGRFKRLLEKTAFAMAQQDVRYYLNGLYIEFGPLGLKGVATDGHRLARFDLLGDFDVKESFGIIVPHKAVNEIRRHLSASDAKFEVDVGEKLIRFGFSNGIITSKLVDGRYPDFERVIPSGLTRMALLDRDFLRRGLARTSVLSNEKFRGVRLEFEKGLLRLRAHNPEQEEATEELEMDYSGDPVVIGFNVGYLGDVLGAIDSEKVEVRFEDGSSSSIWRGAGETSETYVVMPMRL